MATTHPISVEEYLHSSFEHHAEYVEGRIVHRPMPKRLRSQLQKFQFVSVVESESKTGEISTAETRERVRDGVFRAGDLVVDLNG